jgi:hypothetical protein
MSTLSALLFVSVFEIILRLFDDFHKFAAVVCGKCVESSRSCGLASCGHFLMLMFVGLFWKSG